MLGRERAGGRLVPVAGTPVVCARAGLRAARPSAVAARIPEARVRKSRRVERFRSAGLRLAMFLPPIVALHYPPARHHPPSKGRIDVELKPGDVALQAVGGIEFGQPLCLGRQVDGPELVDERQHRTYADRHARETAEPRAAAAVATDLLI